MKKILSLIVCLMLSSSLVGCGSSESVSSNIKITTISGRPFMEIELENYRKILVDINERTQYLIIGTMSHYGNGIELLVDSEGKPLLYKGEIPYERAE